MSVRLKLTLSYVAFLLLAGALLLAAVWMFLLRCVPDRALILRTDTPLNGGVFPIRSNLLHVFAPRAAAVLAFLLIFGLLAGWILAGRMLAPLTQIADAARMAGNGSLSHRIRMNEGFLRRQFQLEVVMQECRQACFDLLGFGLRPGEPEELIICVPGVSKPPVVGVLGVPTGQAPPLLA